MEKQESIMSPSFAVFNCHVNDAKSKANEQFIRMFGQKAYDEIIKPLHEKGIMIILDDTDSKRENIKRHAWITLCWYFVNENK